MKKKKIIYPSIDDNNFYKKMNNIYKKYKIEKNNKNIDNYCNENKFKLQEPQKFLYNYINPKTPYRSLLIFHRIGSGKTCSAIKIAEQWKKKKKIIFVLPFSIKCNFLNELRGQCCSDVYLKHNEKKKLAKLSPMSKEFINIIKKSNNRIKKYYNIYSYNKFISSIKNNNLELNNSILIIDEIQNLISETGVYYKELYNAIYRSNVSVILLSATPICDKPIEIALTMNLLKLPIPFPIGKDFYKLFIKKKKKNNNFFYTIKNKKKIKELVKGYISYYQGAPNFTFPKIKIKYIECPMSKFQYNIYKSIIKKENFSFISKKISNKDIINASDLPNCFFIGTRSVSNIVFPNKKTNEFGFNSLTPNIIRKNLETYSNKFYNIINKINFSNGKNLIYSNFKNYFGIKSLVKILEVHGYKNFKTHGNGKKRFAIWSGDETELFKEQIKEIYNRNNNLYGNEIKIILGSPAIKEGLSLKSVRYVHILEPYWNLSRINQVIGRASRFCSHFNLQEKNRSVKVYIYISVYKKIYTVDKYIKKISETKNKLTKQFENVLKEASIDCYLNQNANDKKISCVQ